ncbi:MAG TPA: ABC transporter permease [Bauldia sp.]|nr:ABC transporter permease [Bauldia sp.]
MSTPLAEPQKSFATAPTARLDAQRGSWRQTAIAGLTGPWRSLPLIIALVGVWILFAIESPLFLSSRNLTNLSNQIAVSSLLALALVFVVVVRQIDISLASLAAVCGGVAAHLTAEEGWNPILAVALALAAGVVVTTFQSWIVMKSKAPSFIVTLGGMFILNAALMWMLPVTQAIILSDTPLQAIAGTYLPDWLSYTLAGLGVAFFGLLRWNYHAARVRQGMASSLMQSTLLPTGALAILVFAVVVYVFNAYRGVPLPTVIVIGTAVILSYVGTQTPLGKYIYAIGGNPEAARRAGIRVELVTAITFSIAGFVAAWAGIINASRLLGVSAQSTDLTLLLVALSAVVVGGVSLFGGRGSVWSVLLGGILMGSIQNGLQLMAVTQEVQWTVQGVVLVVAVVIDASISRHAANPT